VAEHLVAEGIYRDIPENRQRTRKELVKSLRIFFDKHRYQYELIGDAMVSKNSLAFQYRVSAQEEAGANGFTGTYRGAEFMTLSGDAALTITDYYDISNLVQSVNRTQEATGRSSRHKYAKSGLTAAQLEEFKRRLEHVMQSEQAYLRPDMTLPKLAEAVGCSVNHLSQVINAGFGISFFDYLNRHRIEYAKHQLSAYGGNKGAILNVAFAAGFNSNSAFYAAFKKCIGQTPAQYRRAQLRSAH